MAPIPKALWAIPTVQSTSGHLQNQKLGFLDWLAAAEGHLQCVQALLVVAGEKWMQTRYPKWVGMWQVSQAPQPTQKLELMTLKRYPMPRLLGSNGQNTQWFMILPALSKIFEMAWFFRICWESALWDVLNYIAQITSKSWKIMIIFLILLNCLHIVHWFWLC